MFLINRYQSWTVFKYMGTCLAFQVQVFEVPVFAVLPVLFSSIWKKRFNVQLTWYDTWDKKLSAFFCKILHKSAKLCEKSAKLCISCKTIRNSVILFGLFTFYSAVTLVILCRHKKCRFLCNFIAFADFYIFLHFPDLKIFSEINQ